MNKSVTIPADTIASFLKPTANKAEGTMSLVVDRDAITKYVTSDSVTKELTVPKVTREVYITPKDEGGVEIGADKTLGVDGIEVTGAGDAPERLATAIEQNQSTDSTVAVKDSPYDVKQVEVPHNFDTANGDKWVHVDSPGCFRHLTIRSMRGRFAARMNSAVRCYPLERAVVLPDSLLCALASLLRIGVVAALQRAIQRLAHRGALLKGIAAAGASPLRPWAEHCPRFLGMLSPLQ